MDYTQILSDINSNLVVIKGLLQLGVGLLFAIFIIRNRRFLK